MESSFDAQGVDYGHALAATKHGHCATRALWNNENKCIFQRPYDALPLDFLPKVKSLPESIKNRLQNMFCGETHYAGGEPIVVSFNAYLCLLDADGAVANGWVPTQADMQATDWIILS